MWSRRQKFSQVKGVTEEEFVQNKHTQEKEMLNLMEQAMARRELHIRLIDQARVTDTASYPLLGALMAGQNLTIMRSSDPPVQCRLSNYAFPHLVIRITDPILEDRLYSFSELPGLEWIVESQHDHPTMNAKYVRLLLVIKN